MKHFEAEKIGLAELVHLNEDRLHKLGIPMGPRIRIIQEVKNIHQTIHSNGKVMLNHGNNNKQQLQQLQQSPQDSFNIYAVV